MNDIMPALFVPHGGGPCFFMDWDPPHTWDKMAAWLRSIPASLPAKPRAIVLISGHWEEAEFTVSSGAHPSLNYDYSGFPPHTYEIQYPAPGNPALADKIVDLLTAAGISARKDPDHAFDHGVFIPLKVAFPDADIPIVQLSLKSNLDPGEHLAAGRALASLREEGILIIGSGMSYHNLRAFFRGENAVETSRQFDEWLTAAIKDPEHQLLLWADAPSAKNAHPREEHLIPLMVAAGAASAPGEKVFTDQVMGATVSAFRFD